MEDESVPEIEIEDGKIRAYGPLGIKLIAFIVVALLFFRDLLSPSPIEPYFKVEFGLLAGILLLFCLVIALRYGCIAVKYKTSLE